MDYQAERGGKVVFQDVAKPASMEWGSPLQAMEAVLELEKTVSVGSTKLGTRQLLFALRRRPRDNVIEHD